MNFTCKDADFREMTLSRARELRMLKVDYSTEEMESEARRFFAGELRRFADAIDHGYPYVMAASTKNTHNTILEINVLLSYPWGG